MSKIFDNIKTTARKKGIAVSTLEKEAGIANGSVYKWNNVSPSVESLNKVAKVLDVPLESLLKE